jgi:hypothetical protein
VAESQSTRCRSGIVLTAAQAVILLLGGGRLALHVW